MGQDECFFQQRAGYNLPTSGFADTMTEIYLENPLTIKVNKKMITIDTVYIPYGKERDGIITSGGISYEYVIGLIKGFPYRKNRVILIIEKKSGEPIHIPIEHHPAFIRKKRTNNESPNGMNKKLPDRINKNSKADDLVEDLEGIAEEIGFA